MDGVHGQRAVIGLVEATAKYPVVRQDEFRALVDSNEVEVKRVSAQTDASKRKDEVGRGMCAYQVGTAVDRTSRSGTNEPTN